MVGKSLLHLQMFFNDSTALVQALIINLKKTYFYHSNMVAMSSWKGLNTIKLHIDKTWPEWKVYLIMSDVSSWFFVKFVVSSKKVYTFYFLGMWPCARFCCTCYSYSVSSALIEAVILNFKKTHSYYSKIDDMKSCKWLNTIIFYYR